MNELIPCPFCGGKAELEHEYIFGFDYSTIKCKKCGVKTAPIKVSSTYSSDELAAEAWNRRTSHE